MFPVTVAENWIVAPARIVLLEGVIFTPLDVGSEVPEAPTFMPPPQPDQREIAKTKTRMLINFREKTLVFRPSLIPFPEDPSAEGFLGASNSGRRMFLEWQMKSSESCLRAKVTWVPFRDCADSDFETVPMRIVRGFSEGNDAADSPAARSPGTCTRVTTSLPPQPCGLASIVQQTYRLLTVGHCCGGTSK